MYSSEPLRDFHFSRIYRGDALSLSLARHKHYLMARLGLKPGMRVLEVGCGSGSSSLEMARFANVSVIGVDHDHSKIKRARESARSAKLSSRVTFLQGDIDNLTSLFQEESFDAIFAIESLKTAPSFLAIYGQMGKLLKPGGHMGVYEWCWSKSFDSQNPEHCRLAELIETSTCIGRREPSQRSLKCAVAALEESQLQILWSEDLSSYRSALPWYLPLEKAATDSNLNWSRMANNVFGGVGRDAVVIMAQAGRFNLFTPMVMLVAKRQAV